MTLNATCARRELLCGFSFIGMKQTFLRHETNVSSAGNFCFMRMEEKRQEEEKEKGILYNKKGKK